MKKNRLQNAIYEDEYVKEYLNQIQTIEEAISFFAKYGNTTPIKFIYLVRNNSKFRPYDLKVVNYKEIGREYYTVSPGGIVFISPKSTEFIQLTDWMKESTQFNILTNIHFFKNYLKVKIFKQWKLINQNRMFQKNRQVAVHNLFFCKPVFLNPVMELNKIMWDLQNCELVNFNIQQKQMDIEEFKSIQRDQRIKVNKDFDSIFDRIKELILQTIQQIRKNKFDNFEVIEEVRSKNKPINLIKREKMEN